MRWVTGKMLIAAVLTGCAAEALLIGLIWLRRPDPPMDAYDMILIVSQMPGLAIGGAIANALGIAMTNTAGSITMFMFQSPFYIALALLLFRLKKASMASGQP